MVQQDDDAVAAVLKALRDARDPLFARLLCSALWEGGGSKVYAHRATILDLFLASDVPIDVRWAFVDSLRGVFYGNSIVSESQGAQLLRAAQALSGATGEAAWLRSTFADLAVQKLSAPSEAWGEFQRYLQSERDDGVRRQVLQRFFQGSTRRKGSTAAEGLLLEALRGQYGQAAQLDLLQAPLLSWFTTENADAFVGGFRQVAGQASDPARRREAAGQLGLLYLVQRNASALEALRQLQASEADEATKARLAEVIQAADKGALDLDKLMEKLQLRWDF
jgi:hypothetical protein